MAYDTAFYAIILYDNYEYAMHVSSLLEKKASQSQISLAEEGHNFKKNTEC